MVSERFPQGTISTVLHACKIWVVLAGLPGKVQVGTIFGNKQFSLNHYPHINTVGQRSVNKYRYQRSISKIAY
jgi:hypothetical protein